MPGEHRNNMGGCAWWFIAKRRPGCGSGKRGEGMNSFEQLDLLVEKVEGLTREEEQRLQELLVH